MFQEHNLHISLSKLHSQLIDVGLLFPDGVLLLVYFIQLFIECVFMIATSFSSSLTDIGQRDSKIVLD